MDTKGTGHSFPGVTQKLNNMEIGYNDKMQLGNQMDLTSDFGCRAQPDWPYEFPDRTGQTPQFAGQVMPDRTESRLIFSTLT